MTSPSETIAKAMEGVTPGTVKFYVGLHQPADAQHFDLACISIKRLWGRKKPVACGDVLVDSGAFTELFLHGHYRHGVEAYAAELHRLYTSGVVQIAAAVAQDYMCEPFILAKTGLTIEEHQRLTIERYDALVTELERLFGGPVPFHVMPVLQGFAPQDYVDHIRMYGERLKLGMWVGVGSVCKRQGDPRAIVEVLPMKILAYACSARPNALWSAAQYDSALPKNRAECDTPLVSKADAELALALQLEAMQREMASANAELERLRRECSDGLDALSDIDDFWEACPYPDNRKHLSPAEQISSLDCELNAAHDENARLRGLIEEAVRCLDGEPEYHDQGMGCGLEDRGISDRYDAMAHGWEQAMERVYGENIAWAKDALSSTTRTLIQGEKQ